MQYKLNLKFFSEKCNKIHHGIVLGPSYVPEKVGLNHKDVNQK